MVSKPTSENSEPLPFESGWTGEVVCPRCKKENRVPGERCSYCGYSFRETGAFEAVVSNTADNPESLIGRVINDKYRIVSLLGEGGFGVVYKVELLLFDSRNTFALKLLHPSLSGDRNFRRRFLREAALAMQLIHENTIQIREFGRTEDGSLFFTMDYCEGEPLNAVIAREGFLSVNRALRITQQVLSVMQLAHSRGIIHRDLKPENVFLEREGSRRDVVKVGDFGLAKSFLEGADRIDISRGGIFGTPRYMSPEQARGLEDLDHRSDLYSIGVMLYEMLYGNVPADKYLDDGPLVENFGEGAIPDGGQKERGLKADSGRGERGDSVFHWEKVLRPPPHSGHVVPQAVWNIVRRSIAPRRRDRFQSAREFSGAITELPEYTPSYVEPQPIAKIKEGPWWRRLAIGVAVLLVVALPLSFAAEWWSGLRGWNVAEEEGDSRSGLSSFWNGARNGAGSDARSGVGLRGEKNSKRPSGKVISYLPFDKGKQYTYEVFGEKSRFRGDLTFRVQSEPSSLVFRVQEVSPGERTFYWVIDEAKNAFYQKYFLPDPETGELSIENSKELLRLPTVGTLQGDFTEGARKVYGDLRSLGGRFTSTEDWFVDCLCVETHSQSEGKTQRRLEYYKEDVGLVAVEVYEPAGDSYFQLPDDYSGVDEERIVYWRYLKSLSTVTEASSE